LFGRFVRHGSSTAEPVLTAAAAAANAAITYTSNRLFMVHVCASRYKLYPSHHATRLSIRSAVDYVVRTAVLGSIQQCTVFEQ